MKNQNSELAFVINVHQRLCRDSLVTPYKLWCDRVHSSPLTPLEKFERILAWTVIPSEYKNPSIFKSDWQLFKLLSKFSDGGKPTEKQKDVAYDKFIASEERCKHVNDLLRSRVRPDGLNKLIYLVRKILSETLGDVDDYFQSQIADRTPLKLTRDRFSGYSARYTEHTCLLESEAPDCPEFGPGVSVGRSFSGKPTSEASTGAKLLCGTVTLGAASYGNFLSSKWHLPHCSIVPGSRLTYVTKNVGEARTICYEPSMNMLAQKMVGKYIKTLLKTRFGINLSNQKRNRSLAMLGSLCDSWATIDLSSASDLIACQFMMEVLPFRWYVFLDQLRSQRYYDDRRKAWVPFEKFSTMGNGFTFEIETLIFAAVAKAASCIWGKPLRTEEICVYGDDIIIPKAYAPLVKQALLICGHIPNEKKSFIEGPFRESCGGDYFKGWDVTPCKIEEINVEKPRSVVNVYNNLFIRSRTYDSIRSFDSGSLHALRFIEGWLFSRFPKLGHGPDEFTVCKFLDRSVPQPSNRWLWARDGDSTHNNVWSDAWQCMVPKYVLLEEVRIKGRQAVDPDTGRKIWSRAIYDIPLPTLRYFAEKGGRAPDLSTTVEKFRYNRSEILLRAPIIPSKLENY